MRADIVRTIQKLVSVLLEGPFVVVLWRTATDFSLLAH